MLLRIRHETRYDYDPAVVMAQHLAHLSPVDGPGQVVVSHDLQVSPPAAYSPERIDTFGNRTLPFTVPFSHEALRVVADSVVQTHPPEALPEGPNWMDAVDRMTYRAGAPYDPASAFTHASPLVPRDPELAAYARQVWPEDGALLEATRELMRLIHTDMAYRTGSTAVDTPVLEALRQRKGVCQDFSHLMIGCLRSLGLAARYVSGYLMTHPPEGQQRLVGADASHAWVQVYAPDAGWMDFDPTNNCAGWGRPSESHVTLAIGRDFGDVSPLRGVLQGGGQPRLTVGVTVAPADAFPALDD
jgi:transglutaminase-like putative cysteine protease